MREEKTVSKEPLLRLLEEVKMRRWRQFETTNFASKRMSAKEGQFDRAKFATYIGMTMTQYKSLESAGRKGGRINIRTVDQVYTHLGEMARFNEDYPLLESRRGGIPDVAPV